MKWNTEISKKLFIEELERPALAGALITTLAIGEECTKGMTDGATTEAVGEECGKSK